MGADYGFINGLELDFLDIVYSDWPMDLRYFAFSVINLYDKSINSLLFAWKL